MKRATALKLGEVLPFLDRYVLEDMALAQVCACQYYDLADCLSETSDSELIEIINGDYHCDMCGATEEGRE